MPKAAKKKSLTLGDIVKKISQIRANHLLYALLLIAVFLLGYLVSRVQHLENKSETATVPQGQQPAPALAPAEILKTLTNGHFPPLGNKDAKVTIVEFADFRCPFCERYYQDTFPQIKKEYVDTGKAKYVFRNYQFLGEASVIAGNAAMCANEQGKFWEFHDWLYQNQPSESDTTIYNVDSLTTAAGSLGLNTEQFRGCLSSNKYNDKVQGDLEEGQKIGTSGTPTFYINGRQLVGAQPYAQFKAIIEEELKK